MRNSFCLLIWSLTLLVSGTAALAYEDPEEFWEPSAQPASKSSGQIVQKKTHDSRPLQAGQRVLITSFRFGPALQTAFDGVPIAPFERRLPLFLADLFSRQGYLASVSSDEARQEETQPYIFLAERKNIPKNRFRDQAGKPLRTGLAVTRPVPSVPSAGNGTYKLANAVLSGEVEINSDAKPLWTKQAKGKRIIMEATFTATVTLLQEPAGQPAFFIRHTFTTPVTISMPPSDHPDKGILLEHGLASLSETIVHYFIGQEAPLRKQAGQGKQRSAKKTGSAGKQKKSTLNKKPKNP